MLGYKVKPKEKWSEMWENRSRIIKNKSKSVKSDTCAGLNIIPRCGFKIIAQNVHKNVHSNLSNVIQPVGIIQATEKSDAPLTPPSPFLPSQDYHQMSQAEAYGDS